MKWIKTGARPLLCNRHDLAEDFQLEALDVLPDALGILVTMREIHAVEHALLVFAGEVRPAPRCTPSIISGGDELFTPRGPRSCLPSRTS
jgi:hypothetical protein